jgi:hypothetical protein
VRSFDLHRLNVDYSHLGLHSAAVRKELRLIVTVRHSFHQVHEFLKLLVA